MLLTCITRMLPLLIMGLLFSSACLCSPSKTASKPSDTQIREKLKKQAKLFYQIRVLIQTEPQTGVVGDDNIGNCWKIGGRWSCGQDHGLGLSEVLARYEIPQARYQRYLELFKSLGAYRVSRDGKAESEAQVIVYLFRAGIVTSGSSKNVVWMPNKTPSELVDDTDLNRPARMHISYSRGLGPWYIEHNSN